MITESGGPLKTIMVDGPHRVYFVRVGDFIKIGYTREIKRRMYQIDSLTPHEIELLLHINGDTVYEDILHDKFKHLRRKFDWFEATKELVDFIDNLREEQNTYEWMGKRQFSTP